MIFCKMTLVYFSKFSILYSSVKKIVLNRIFNLLYNELQKIETPSLHFLGLSRTLQCTEWYTISLFAGVNS